GRRLRRARVGAAARLDAPRAERDHRFIHGALAPGSHAGTRDEPRGPVPGAAPRTGEPGADRARRAVRTGPARAGRLRRARLVRPPPADALHLAPLSRVPPRGCPRWAAVHARAGGELPARRRPRRRPLRNVLQDDARMNTLKGDVERGRAAYAERSWLEAYEAFAGADESGPLTPEDLELGATTARMLARDNEAVETLERAHHAYVASGNLSRAAYCAGWIGVTLFYNGAVGPAGGWLARANR